MLPLSKYSHLYLESNCSKFFLKAFIACLKSIIGNLNLIYIKFPFQIYYRTLCYQTFLNNHRQDSQFCSESLVYLVSIFLLYLMMYLASSLADLADSILPRSIFLRMIGNIFYVKCQFLITNF